MARKIKVVLSKTGVRRISVAEILVRSLELNVDEAVRLMDNTPSMLGELPRVVAIHLQDELRKVGAEAKLI